MIAFSTPDSPIQHGPLVPHDIRQPLDLGRSPRIEDFTSPVHPEIRLDPFPPKVSAETHQVFAIDDPRVGFPGETKVAFGFRPGVFLAAVIGRRLWVLVLILGFPGGS
jgi:hypothetical protein